MMFDIVYVDNEQILRDVGKELLEAQAPDFKVITFDNPKDALVHIKNAKVDAIVSDYWMVPDSGINFLIKVRQIYDGLPFILFTGRGKEEVVIEALNEGADFYLQKGGDIAPTFAELEHMIRKSIERRANEKIIIGLKAALLALPTNIETKPEGE